MVEVSIFGVDEEDVAGLEIAVEDLVSVAEVDGAACRQQDVHRPLDGQRRLQHHGAEALALEVLHHDVGLSVVDAVVVNLDDVLVGDAAGGDRLVEEALGVLRLGGDEILVQRLDRHLALHYGVERPVHLPHPAAAHQVPDHEPALRADPGIGSQNFHATSLRDMPNRNSATSAASGG